MYLYVNNYNSLVRTFPYYCRLGKHKRDRIYWWNDRECAAFPYSRIYFCLTFTKKNQKSENGISISVGSVLQNKVRSMSGNPGHAPFFLLQLIKYRDTQLFFDIFKVIE